jgi:hypothetical protein
MAAIRNDLQTDLATAWAIDRHRTTGPKFTEEAQDQLLTPATLADA